MEFGESHPVFLMPSQASFLAGLTDCCAGQRTRLLKAGYSHGQPAEIGVICSRFSTLEHYVKYRQVDKG